MNVHGWASSRRVPPLNAGFTSRVPGAPVMVVQRTQTRISCRTVTAEFLIRTSCLLAGNRGTVASSRLTGLGVAPSQEIALTAREWLGVIVARRVTFVPALGVTKCRTFGLPTGGISVAPTAV